MTRTLVAVVDDDHSMREAMTSLLASHGFEVVAFESGANLLADPLRRELGCLIADVHMPGMSGLEMHERLTREQGAPPTVFMTGGSKDSDRARALALGAVAYVEKPVAPERLIAFVRAALGDAGPGL